MRGAFFMFQFLNLSMTPEQLHSLKYPIGGFQISERQNSMELENWIESISQFPSNLFDIVSSLSSKELNWIYRPGGWAIKQVVHHCADSHMNAFIRLKLALTEEAPTIKPYEEGEWALLSDSQSDDVSDSLAILQSLHSKWVTLLRGLSASDLERTYVHPDKAEPVKLYAYIAEYSWHCKHHLAHVKQGLEFEGRF